MTIYTSQYDWMRNDYHSKIKVGGIEYPTAEHAYQAAKTTDKTLKKAIADQVFIADARKMGRNLDLPDNWDDRKGDIMQTILRQKFMQNEEIADRLMKTDYDSIVADMRDEYWGTGKNGFGENYLGAYLEEVRQEIQILNGYDPESDEEKEPDQEDINRTIAWHLEYESDDKFTKLVMDLYKNSLDSTKDVDFNLSALASSVQNLNGFAKKNIVAKDESKDDDEEFEDEDDLD
jgi:ribA/ribD-fused uncharacterized protein